MAESTLETVSERTEETYIIDPLSAYINNDKKYTDGKLVCLTGFTDTDKLLNGAVGTIVGAIDESGKYKVNLMQPEALMKLYYDGLYVLAINLIGMYIFMFIFICKYVYVYIYEYVCIYMYIYTYM
jgi:predicted  nucleic acid-binding Zn-ribbon protein